MKILRVINSLNIGGAERSVVGNIPVHVKNGFAVDVLLLTGARTHFYNELIEKKIRIIDLGINNMYNPLILFKIAKLINKYDLLHVSLFPALYWVAITKILTRSKTKLMFTEHNTSNNRRGNRFFKIIEKIIYSQYDQLIAISPEATENLSNHLDDKIQIKTIYNGVDVAKVFEESKDCGSVVELRDKFKNSKVVLQVASFRNQKDQDTLIKALPLINADVSLLFAGDGNRLTICKDLAKEMKVEDRISFLGIQNNIHALYGIADIVVMSSHYEGFGRAAVEGMAARKPVVASNVAGLSKIVANHGILFESGNHIELAQIINRLTTDSILYEEVASQCYERAKEYDILKMITEYELIYNQLNV